MAKSDFARKMDGVIRNVGGHLEREGFSKKHHTFNRVVEPGLVHVIDFQMGAYRPGNPPDVPPYVYNLYGKFTVNISVYVAEIREIEWLSDSDPWSPGKFIPEGSCQIRWRLGDLMPEKRDRWWGLDVGLDELDATMFLLLDEFGLPFLENYRSREATLRELEKGRSEALHYGLYAAIMQWKQGNTERALEILTEDLQQDLVERPNFAGYILKMADRMGFQLQHEN